MMRPDHLVVATALRIEALVVRSALPGVRVVRTGMGPERASRWAATAGLEPGPALALAVAGVCGGLDPRLRPGAVVVASEVRGPDGVLACPTATLLEEALARRGLRAHLGPLVSVDHVVRGEQRARLRAAGAIAADMESAFLAAAAGRAVPLAVLRVVVDTPGRELIHPATVVNGPRALRTLRRAAPALADWAAVAGRAVRSNTPEEVG